MKHIYLILLLNLSVGLLFAQNKGKYIVETHFTVKQDGERSIKEVKTFHYDKNDRLVERVSNISSSNKTPKERLVEEFEYNKDNRISLEKHYLLEDGNRQKIRERKVSYSKGMQDFHAWTMFGDLPSCLWETYSVEMPQNSPIAKVTDIAGLRMKEEAKGINKRIITMKLEHDKYFKADFEYTLSKKELQISKAKFYEKLDNDKLVVTYCEVHKDSFLPTHRKLLLENERLGGMCPMMMNRDIFCDSNTYEFDNKGNWIKQNIAESKGLLAKADANGRINRVIERKIYKKKPKKLN